MLLVDTSIWIDHFRKGSRLLEELLINEKVACHQFIVGELACGTMKNRREILSLLQTLPMTPLIELSEFIYFIEKNNLTSEGIGFVDIHLLASAKLSEIHLLTSDQKLKKAAVKLNIAYNG